QKMRLQLPAQRVELRFGEECLQLLRVQPLGAQLGVIADAVVEDHHGEVNHEEKGDIDAEGVPRLHQNRVVDAKPGVFQRRLGGREAAVDHDENDRDAASRLHEEELEQQYEGA